LVEKYSFTRFPLAKIKSIMKTDEEIKACQKNAYYIIGKMTELFLQELSSNTRSILKINKRKTMNLEDIACAVKSFEKYNFIQLNSIFNIETVEDMKNKEEYIEKKMQKLNHTGEKFKKPTQEKGKKEKINKKGLQAAAENMKIDQIFNK
jgi:histone H3/H4